ncbi:DUF6384 family protein [Hyphomonas sp.]|uniref:DUF6384 family protein n=1 Tax=Hyphomonas sp. TaxID=87 RepID=UPI0025BA0E32|nr:DUF6384 family protein [Hyphomonas sp.]
MSDTAVPAVRDKSKLDDVLLAMDVVDTLRHREQLVLTELDAGAREAALLGRLKDIYAAQGIDVPERILKEGVKALEEKRFLYEPPKPSLSVSLAKLYITRDRWLAPAMFALVAAAALLGAWQIGVVAPAKAEAQRVQIELTQTLPAELTRLHGEIAAAALEDGARLQAQALLSDGRKAVGAGDAAAARLAVTGLQTLQADLLAIYQVRVVYGPGEEYTGVFRIPDDVPGARNFYLIVEAVDLAGRLVEVPVTSEEDRKSARVTRWGQRVSEAVFNGVAADKGDDQIVQNAIIGQKTAGYLSPQYTVETPGGAILEW